MQCVACALAVAALITLAAAGGSTPITSLSVPGIVRFDFNTLGIEVRGDKPDTFVLPAHPSITNLDASYAWASTHALTHTLTHTLEGEDVSLADPVYNRLVVLQVTFQGRNLSRTYDFVFTFQQNLSYPAPSLSNPPIGGDGSVSLSEILVSGFNNNNNTFEMMFTSTLNGVFDSAANLSFLCNKEFNISATHNSSTALGSIYLKDIHFQAFLKPDQHSFDRSDRNSSCSKNTSGSYNMGLVIGSIIGGFIGLCILGYFASAYRQKRRDDYKTFDEVAWYKSVRYTVALMTFLGFLNVYALRVNLSVAIVKMADEYGWTSERKGNVLSSFFYGYILTQIPGGWFATHYGAKKVFGYGVLMTALLTLFTPMAAEHYTVLIALRVLEGFGEGVTYPAILALWARWAPSNERTRLCTIGYSGAFLGTVIALPISGVLAGSSFLGGWPSVFYVFGAVACVWFVGWMVLLADDPESHPTISIWERDYIEMRVSKKQSASRTPKTPWKSILTSIPVWAVVITCFCNNWGFYTLLTCLPTYFNDVLRFSIEDGGFLAGLPYLSLFLTCLIVGWATDRIRAREVMSTTKVRKLVNTVGYVIAAGFMILAGYTHKGQNGVAVAALAISQIGIGFAMSGYNVNHLDIAPRYGGVLMGIANSAGTIPGFVAPTVAGALTPCTLCNDKASPFDGQYWKGPTQCPPSLDAKGFVPCTAADAAGEWHVVFFIAAGIFLFGAIIFLLFASGEEQSWNNPEEERKPSSLENKKSTHLQIPYGSTEDA